MKYQNLPIALIIAVAMLLSAGIVSSGLKSLGTSLERAAASIGKGMAAQRPTTIPPTFRIDLGEIKIGNGGGGGESFRIQSSGN